MTEPKKTPELDELVSLVRRAPPQAGDWSWNRSYDFKVAHKRATAVANAKAPTLERITQALSQLRPYYAQEGA